MEVAEGVLLSSPCLLCSSPGSPLPGGGDGSDDDDDAPSLMMLLPGSRMVRDGDEVGEEEYYCSRLLNTNLWSVFVLRTLLNFPKGEVEGLLRGMGGLSPGDWYTLCHSCSGLAKQTMELQRQIFELQRRIAEQRAQAIDKLRSSIENACPDENTPGGGGGGGGVVMCARAAVREYFKAHLCKMEDVDRSAIINRENLSMEVEESDSFSPVPSEAMESSGGEEEEVEEDEFGKDKEEDPPYNPKRNNTSSRRRTRGTTKPKAKNVNPRASSTIKRQRRRRGRNGGVIGRPRKLDKDKKPPFKKVIVTSATPETGGTQCPICKRWFSPDYLPTHVRKHEQSEEMRCKLCSFKSAREAEIKRHVKRHAEDPNFVFFQCEKCDFSCSSGPRKHYHMQKHKIEDNIESSPSSGEFSCKLCSADGFESMLKINLHLREAHGPQLGLQTFSCPHCPNSFTSNHLLKLHISSQHERVFKHNCDQCGFGCNLGSDLRNHIASFHSGGKKEYICDICGKEFAVITNLRSHKKLHNSGEGRKRRPLACKYCSDYVPTSNRKLTEHMKREHGELYGIQCSKCPERFIKLYLLLKHEKLKHAEES